MKMGNKARAPKQALRIKHTGLILKPTQNACIKQENLRKPRSESSLSMTKAEKLQVDKHSSHEATSKGYSLIFQRDKTNRYPDSEDPSIVKKTKHKPQAPHVSAEDLKSLVCLTQAQLQQILMIVKEGRSISETHNEKQEEVATNEASEENVIASLQKDCEVSPVPDEANSDSGRKQEAHLQPGQKVIKDLWKPADLFSTLGEREGEKALLEFKKTQWKKELDEQVALKKKLKETLEGEVGCFWTKLGSNKTHKVEPPDPDQTVFPADSVHGTEESSACTAALATEVDGVALNVPRAPAGQSSDFTSSDLPAGSCTALAFREAVPQEQPFSALKHEQQKKWLEELDKQKEEAKLQKIEEKLNLSKAEEHDRWEMHFDSFKNHLSANAQQPLNGMHRKPESLSLSPDPKDSTAFIHRLSPAALGNLMPLQRGTAEKAAKNGALEQSQRVSFLRSMTALLDPAQIEERDRRRQKQLEHQKAIMAQVEEKRKKKQLEEEQRKWEEQQEELRLAREKAQLQKQFEEEMLKQKQKEELVTLKAKELYQTVEKAQELAQGSKQEQRIPDLSQKAHDISALQNNPGGGDTGFENCNSGISAQSTDFPDGVESPPEQQASPRKDTAVQTDCFNTSAHTESAEERTAHCESPDISIEYKETSNSKKYQKEMQYMDKNKLPGKETGDIYSDLYEQYARKERHIKSSEKYSKRPDWNINKPGKRYIPASERYPKPLQKQREENKVRRQMELLQLVERNSPGQLSTRRGGHSARSLSPREETAVKSKGHRGRKEEKFHKNHLNEERSESPPVPAVRNRLLQVQQRQMQASHFLLFNHRGAREDSPAGSRQRRSPAAGPEAARPPSAQFVPFLRTREVYCLDPAAPLSPPSTQHPQHPHLHDSYQMPQQIFNSDHVRDPLLNPDVVTIRERQQAILKGLSKLRQGLLQKQKELENTLIPIVAQENFMPPF
ncbi:coiled-coil domain-containing protein 66 isoform X5 [Poecile atricapillus]|nr:coiled-coil domain-containing protein 66 isoform X5 [Poecile atricapillus]XP_058700556.1 coiled-coil domain-containing protein 66 isoform X5 [Poecile atricapillus]XP_058700557.1 coiled-coil domain-containing protein 66 isoform X5 [Poecile atricapillus]